MYLLHYITLIKTGEFAVKQFKLFSWKDEVLEVNQ